MTIFVLWMAFFVASLACVFTAQWRTGSPIDPGRANDGVSLVLAIVLPILACFAAFWFPASQRKLVSGMDVDPSQVIAALALTGVFHGLTLLMIVDLFFFTSWPAVWETPPGESYSERLKAIQNVATVGSTLVLAPVVWITLPRASADAGGDG